MAVALAFPAGLTAARRYVVVLLGNTWRVPLFGTVPSPGSIDTDVASLTDQRKVADCPRSIEVGSAENETTTAALEVSVVVVVVVVDGAGGGGVVAMGVFFLHPAAKVINNTLINIVARFCILNLNPPSHFPHTGMVFRPSVVSCCTCVPSASIVNICILPPVLLDANTRCRPSGAQFGFSFRPAPCVN